MPKFCEFPHIQDLSPTKLYLHTPIPLTLMSLSTHRPPLPFPSLRSARDTCWDQPWPWPTSFASIVPEIPIKEKGILLFHCSPKTDWKRKPTLGLDFFSSEDFVGQNWSHGLMGISQKSQSSIWSATMDQLLASGKERQDWPLFLSFASDPLFQHQVGTFHVLWWKTLELCFAWNSFTEITPLPSIFQWKPGPASWQNF